MDQRITATDAGQSLNQKKYIYCVKEMYGVFCYHTVAETVNLWRML